MKRASADYDQGSDWKSDESIIARETAALNFNGNLDRLLPTSLHAIQLILIVTANFTTRDLNPRAADGHELLSNRAVCNLNFSISGSTFS